MSLTCKEAFDLSLISYFSPYEHTHTVEELIDTVKADEALLQAYEHDLLFQQNLIGLRQISSVDYRDFHIEEFYDDNQNSGLVLYRIARAEEMILAIRGSEALDHLFHQTKWQDWMDNFQMFFPGPTPQQLMILHYLNQQHFTQPLSICGHSKGGNLALFLAMASSDTWFHQMERVITFNAPGITASLMQDYHERIICEAFQSKVQLYENENDTISAFFLHVKEPVIVKSVLPCNTFLQAYQNHNLYAMVWEEDTLTAVSRKTVLPIMCDHFINGFFAKLSIERLTRIQAVMNDYFQSDLPLSELYRVLIYHISRYTNIFDDVSYEEVKHITFSDLLARRKTRKISKLIMEDLPAFLNEQDIQQISSVIQENYQLLKQGASKRLQNIVKNNNILMVEKIKDIQNRSKK